MGFIKQPSGGYFSAYRPLCYEIKVLEGTVALSYDFIWNGKVKKTFCTECIDKNGCVQIDLSPIVQECMSCDFHPIPQEGELPSFNTPFDNPSTYGTIAINIYYGFLDADGLIQMNTEPDDTSDDATVFNAIIQDCDLKCYPDYNLYTDPSDIEVKARIQSNKPQGCRFVCLGDTEYLTPHPFVTGNITAIFYNSAGQQIDFQAKPITSTPRNSYNLGPSGFSDIDFSDVCYYDVGWLGYGTRFIILPKSQCCKMVRVHFCNDWGVMDSFSFSCVKKSNKTTSKNYNKPIQKIYAKSESFPQAAEGNQHKGIDTLNRFNIKSGESWKLEANGLKPEELEWLQEFARTPKAYLEIDKAYSHFTINPSSFCYYESGGQNNSVKFNITLQNLITH